MRVLLDECVPARLARELSSHSVSTVPREGWAGIGNGKLLGLIEASGNFEVFVTVDKNLPRQQTIQNLPFAVIVLRAPSNSIDDLLPLLSDMSSVLERAKPGEFCVLGE